MKRRDRSLFSPALVINGAAFFLGAFAGSRLALHLAGNGGFTLSQALSNMDLALEHGVRPSYTALLWNTLRWPLLALLLGLTALGVWMLPLAFALHGGLLAYCLSGVSAALGWPMALLLFGLSGLCTVPVFFLLGVRSWNAAASIQGGLLPPDGIGNLIDAVSLPLITLCTALLLLFSYLEYRLFPSLIMDLIP